MLTGKLKERILVLQKETTADGQGGRSTSWVTFCRAWANVMPARTTERLQAAAIGATLSYVVTMPYRGDITPAMRISWTPYQSETTKTLEIHGVMPKDGGRRFLELACAVVI